MGGGPNQVGPSLDKQMGGGPDQVGTQAEGLENELVDSKNSTNLLLPSVACAPHSSEEGKGTNGSLSRSDVQS